MKLQVNETTLKEIKEMIPEEKNVFKRLKYAIDLMNSVQVEINNKLKNGEVLIVKEDNE